MTTYQKMNKDILVMLEAAKVLQGWTDEELAKALKISDRTIRRQKKDGTLPEMSFAQIFTLSKMAGYEMSVPRSKGGTY